MADNVIIVQQTNRDGTKLLAPKVPEAAVYDAEGKLLSVKLTDMDDKIGDLSTLKTTDKSSLVEAINEVSGGDVAVYDVPDDEKSLQEQLTETNATYIIQHEHKIDDELTIPEGCILDFRGGSIKGTTYINGVESDNDDAVTTYTDIEITDNRVTITPTVGAAFETSESYTATVTVAAGDRFFITGEAIGSTPLYVFKNASGAAVESATATKMYWQVITAPVAGTLEFKSTPYVGSLRKITQLVTHSGSVVFDDTEIRNSNFKNVTTNDDFTLSDSVVRLDKMPFYNEWGTPKECTAMLQKVLDWSGENGMEKIIFPYGKEYLLCISDYDGVSFFNKDTSKNGLVVNNCNIDFNDCVLRLEVNRVVSYAMLRVQGESTIQNLKVYGDKEYKDYQDIDSYIEKSAVKYYVTNEFNHACVNNGGKCLFYNSTFGYVHGDGMNSTAWAANHTTGIGMKVFTAESVNSTTGELEVSTTWSVSPPYALPEYTHTAKYVVPKLAYIFPDGTVSSSKMITPSNCPINNSYYISFYNNGVFVTKKEYRLGDVVEIEPTYTHARVECQSIDRTPYTVKCTWWFCTSNGSFYNTIDKCLITDCGRNGLVLAGERFMNIKDSTIVRFGGTNNEIGIDMEDDETLEYLNYNNTLENLTIGNALSKNHGGGAINLGNGISCIVRNCTLTGITAGVYGKSYGHIVENVKSDGYIRLSTYKNCQLPDSFIRNCTAPKIGTGKGVVENCIITDGLSVYNYADNGVYECTYRKCTVYSDTQESQSGYKWSSLVEDCVINVSEAAAASGRTLEFVGGDYKGCTFNIPFLRQNAPTNFENCTFNVSRAYNDNLPVGIYIANKFIGNTINGVFPYSWMYRFALIVQGSNVAEISNNKFIFPSTWIGASTTYTDYISLDNESLNYVYFKNNTFDYSAVTSGTNQALFGFRNYNNTNKIIYIEGIRSVNSTSTTLCQGVGTSDNNKKLSLYIKDIPCALGANQTAFKESFIWKGNSYMREADFSQVGTDTTSGRITPATGEQYYDAATSKLYVFNGTAWEAIGA